MISIIKEEIGNVKDKIERTQFFHINMNTIVNAILKDNEVVGFVDYYIDTTRSEIYLELPFQPLTGFLIFLIIVLKLLLVIYVLLYFIFIFN